MTDVTVTYEFIGKAMRDPAVVGHLQTIATRVQRRAEMLAGSEGVKGNFWTEAGVRPGGRPRVNVYCDNVEQEWGSSKTARRRVLGRAAESA